MRERLETAIEKVVEEIKKEKEFDEANTIQILVMPIIEALGYKGSDYIEREYQITGKYLDLLLKKGDDNPLIYVECKSQAENLDKHKGQLKKYFNMSEKAKNVKLAILTNGIEYWFFSDFDEINKMDDKPHHILTIEDVKEQDYIF